jgi:hypothetical protein
MGHRWSGYGHPTLYKMINTGPGPAASDPQTSYWQSLSKDLTEIDQALNKKLTGLNATWEGAAAERAQTGLTPLAEWANDAQSASTVMKTSTELQANYVADARSSMPEPVPVTTPSPSGWAIAGAAAAALTGNAGPAVAVAAQAADHEAQEAAQNEAEQRAIQTMQSYESSSTWNRETLGTFVAPPDVVVSSPPPAALGGAGVGGVGTFSGGVGGASGGGTESSGFTPPTGTASIPTVGGGGAGGVGGGGGGGGVGGGGGGGGFPLPHPTAPPQITTPNNVAPPIAPPPYGMPPVVELPGNPPGNPPYNPQFNGSPPFGPSLNNPFNQNNPTGRPPVVGLPAGPNAGDVARNAQSLRGMPGGLGGLGGLDPDGTRAGSQYGRMGGMPGESVVRTGPGGATAANAAGRGSGPMGAGGRRGEGEDDDEHFAADYLMETDDVWGDADLRVAPTVIGEVSPQQ